MFNEHHFLAYGGLIASRPIVNAWSSDSPSHQGKFCRLDEEITLYPRPMQQPHPPIWVAGTSAVTLGWVGSRGYDIMNVQFRRHSPRSDHQIDASLCQGSNARFPVAAARPFVFDKGFNSRALIDATQPFEWKENLPPGQWGEP
jgi:hypothetical protein